MYIYLALGVLWCGFLEYLTTKALPENAISPWRNRERLFHTGLWPFSLITFLIALTSGSPDEEQ